MTAAAAPAFARLERFPVDTCSRKESASNQESKAPFRFNRDGKGSGDGAIDLEICKLAWIA
jgi:hypothetical protein